MKRFNPKPGSLRGYFNVGGREPWQDHCLQIPGSLIDLRGPQYICFFAGDDVLWHFFQGANSVQKKKMFGEKSKRRSFWSLLEGATQLSSFARVGVEQKLVGTSSAFCSYRCGLQIEEGLNENLVMWRYVDCVAVGQFHESSPMTYHKYP